MDVDINLESWTESYDNAECQELVRLSFADEFFMRKKGKNFRILTKFSVVVWHRIILKNQLSNKLEETWCEDWKLKSFFVECSGSEMNKYLTKENWFEKLLHKIHFEEKHIPVRWIKYFVEFFFICI